MIQLKLLRLRSWAVFALAPVMLPASLAVAQEAPPEPVPNLFGEVIDVRVINVEVVVTDKQGVPVHGLSPADFRLLVDGEEVAIDYFTEIRGNVAVEPAPPAAPGPGGLPGIAPGEPVATSYLVFIDDFFSVARDRNQVIESLIDQLPFLGPADRMAVVAFDGAQIDMLTSWTSSSAALERVFREALERPAQGLLRLAEQRQFENFRRLDNLARPTATSLTFEEREYARRLAEQVERSVLAATATLRGFASPPGRKVMLLLAGGWPYSPIEYAVDQVELVLLERDLPEGQKLFSPLTRTANLLGYTLYPIDVPGLGTIGGVDAGASDPDLRATSFSVRENEIHDALRYVADETGGKALLNANRVAALGEVVQDTRSYYWLGFNARRKGDEAEHDIRVEVTRPGLKIRTREGFQDLSRQTEVSMAVESVLLFGNPPGFENLPVEVGEARRRGRKIVELPLIIAIPAAGITFLPEPEKQDSFVGQVELRVASLDADGNRSEVAVVPLAMRIGKKPQPGEAVRYETTLKLRRNTEKVVVSIYDPVSANFFSRSLDLDL